jgi:hypothetical protein
LGSLDPFTPGRKNKYHGIFDVALKIFGMLPELWQHMVQSSGQESSKLQ